MKAFLAATSLALAGTLSLGSQIAFADQAPRVVAPIMMEQSGAIEAFVPRPSSNLKFDYSLWDDAISNMVLDMGPSLRRRAQRPDAPVGTRIVRGHQSAYRLEGSRFTFAYVNDSYKEGLTEYRKDLEALGTQYDIATLPRNEQLAYWINLHNVGLIEQISNAYPISRPSRIRIEQNGTKVPMEDARFMTVKGVPLSLKDIRTRIVFPNWSDRPEVIYAFFRGEIGGPRLSPFAFSGNSVDYMLDQNAEEFINSLRGFNLTSKARKVSEIYKEAAPFYFPDLGDDLIRHMAKHARDDVRGELYTDRPIEFDTYDTMVADLSGGNRIGASALNVTSSQRLNGTRLSAEILQTLREANQKLITLRREGLIGNAGGEVIIEDITTEDLTPDPAYAPYANSPPTGDE